LPKTAQQEHIEGLKAKAISSPYSLEQIGVIDALAKYREEAIPAITEIVEASESAEARLHGLAVLRKIKDSTE
jgi:hypothetical protein